MRISFDDRVQAVSNRGLYPRKIVDKFYRLKVVDLFWVLSEYSEMSFDKDEMLGYVRELFDKRSIEAELEEINVGWVIEILDSLHRNYDEYSENEKKLLGALFVQTVI